MDFKLLFFVNLPFSGLGSSFFNFCSFLFKINSIKTLISRWFNVCSNYKDMHCEFNFLKTFFISNGFPVSLVNSNSKKFLQNRFVPSQLDSPSKKKIYVSLPYFGYQSEKLQIELSNLLSKYFSSIDFHIILDNNYKIGSLFPCKDKLPSSLQSLSGV